MPSNTRFFNPATLITAPSGQRLPFKTATPPSGMIGLLGRKDDLAVRRIRVAIFLGERPAGDSQASPVDVAAFDQRADHTAAPPMS